MEISVQAKGALTHVVTATIPADVVSNRMEEYANLIAKQMTVPGFRPGKVPAKIAKQKHGPKMVHDLSEQLIQEAISKAVTEHNIRVAGQPEVEGHPHVHEGHDFTFTATLETFPTVQPAGLTGITLTRYTATPTEQMGTKMLDDLKRRMATYRIKRGSVEQGDRVTVSGQGYVVEGQSEVAFDGGKLEKFQVIIGSGSLIPGFEDQLEGATIDEKRNVRLAFPADYHAKELAGKNAVFKLKIDKIEMPNDVVLDDKFAEQFGLQSFADMQEMIRNGLQADLDRATTQRLKRELLDHLDAQNTFDLPENMVKRELNSLIQQQVYLQQQRGVTFEAADIELLRTDLEPIARRRVKLGLLLAEIAKVYELQVTEMELRQAISEQIQDAGPEGDSVRKYFSEPRHRNELIGPILEDKVTKKLLADATVTEAQIAPEELLKEFE